MLFVCNLNVGFAALSYLPFVQSVDTFKNVDVLMVYPIHVIFSVTDVVNNLVLMVYTCNIFSNRCGQQFSLLQLFRSYVFTTFVIRFVVICGIDYPQCLIILFINNCISVSGP